MTVFGLVKLLEYDPERHTLPSAHDNLRIADIVYMVVSAASGEMWLSWQPTRPFLKAMRGGVLENTQKGEPAKVLAHGSLDELEFASIWARNKITEDKPTVPRHPQLSRQQLTDLLDHAFSELEAWDKMVDELVLTGFKGADLRLNAGPMLNELRPRIKALIERLSEYK